MWPPTGVIPWFPKIEGNTYRWCVASSLPLWGKTRRSFKRHQKPLVKPMAPGSIFYHISFQSTFICIFTFCIYIIKYQKYIYLILLSLLDLTFASGRERIDNPFIALVASSLFVCVGSWDLWGASYWIDTLVLKNWGKYLRYFAASPFPLQGKTNAVLKR